MPTRTPSLGLSLAALALGGFGIGTTEFATLGLLPDIATGLHTSIPTAGHLVSLYALGVVVGAPLFAVVGAKIERKRLLLALMALFGLANLGSALAPSFGVLAVARFVSGLPHGAYFGIGAVVAAELAGPAKRGRAFAMMMLGLTVANIVGVPASTRLGQLFGWRATFALVAVIAALTLAAVQWALPRVPVADGSGISRELGALRRPQVWLALGMGAVGFGGFFAVYSYITPTMTQVAGLPAADIWIVLAVFGLGMTAGNVIGGRLADHAVLPTVVGSMLAVIAILVTFTLVAHHAAAATAMIFLLGAAGSACIPALQTRLMDVAEDAQGLAAALNHAALNIANALGAWLGGLVIAAGYSYASTAWVGVVLAGAGLVVVGFAVALQRRTPVAACAATV